ncbi:hypothetical protein L9F63_016458, partial [Diploptera punctata]
YFQVISRVETLSRAVWLLFLSKNTSIDSFFSNIYVPFNCKFLVAQNIGKHFHLTEVYRVADGTPLMTYPYGRWSVNVTYVTGTTLYERRKHLHGFKMKGVTINVSEFSIKEESNGSWNGMIEMLRNRQVDVGMSGFTLTEERMQVVDFTFPIIYMRYQVFIRQPMEEEIKWDDYLKPFSLHLWVTLSISVLVVSVVLSNVHVIGRHFGNEEIRSSSRYCLYDSFFYVFGIFCQQGHAFTPIALSSRIVYLTAYLTAVVTLSAYSAALISFLTRKTTILPFQNLQQLMQDDTYQLGVLDGSSEFNLFSNSEDPEMKNLYERMLAPYTMPKTNEEGFHRLCSGRYAFITTIRHTSAQFLCRLTVLPMEAFPVTTSIVLTKDSPYRDILNHRLLTMGVEGSLHRLRTSWLKSKLGEQTRPWEEIGINSLVPILTILTVGAVTAAAVLLCEKELHKRSSLRRKSKTISSHKIE